MALNIEKMKDVFMSGDKETMMKMLNFIKNDLGISESDYWNYIGYYVISVSPKQYKHVLLEGKKFACLNDIGMYWINHYNERRGPIAINDIGYGLLPKKIIPGEEKKEFFNKNFWGYSDDNTPKTILEYFDAMRDYLKVEKIIKTYCFADDALMISTLEEDYEKNSSLLKEFVKKYGYGPFEEIHSLSFTGECDKEPILIKK